MTVQVLPRRKRGRKHRIFAAVLLLEFSALSDPLSQSIYNLRTPGGGRSHAPTRTHPYRNKSPLSHRCSFCFENKVSKEELKLHRDFPGHGNSIKLNSTSSRQLSWSVIMAKNQQSKLNATKTVIVVHFCPTLIHNESNQTQLKHFTVHTVLVAPKLE